jgi:dipeptidyl aminopeptidase/acylaminoacyl peptidase
MRAVHRCRLLPGMLFHLLLIAPAAAQQQPTLTPSDYAKWESFGATEMSPDGRWFAYVIQRVDGDGELRYRPLTDDSTRVVPHAFRPSFSRDGRWLAYGMGVSTQERERLEKSGQPVRSKLGIVDLRSGSKSVIDDVAGFDFSGDSRFISMRGYATGEGKSDGVDVIVRELATGTQLGFGNVAASAWQDRGSLLALVIDAENRAANGVNLYDAASGSLRVLETDSARYTGLVWRRNADDLAVLRVMNDERYEEATHVVLAWRGVARARPAVLRLDPTTRSALPADHRIAETRELRWSDDGSTIFFGIREWTGKPPPPVVSDSAANDAATRSAGAAEEPAGVEVWHSADVDIIPEQKVRAGLERNRTMLTAWRLDSDRVVRLADDLRQDVTLSDGRYAVLLDGRPHDTDRMFGPIYRDIYIVDVTTGERIPVVQRVQHAFGPSTSTGRYALYLRDGDYWAFDVHTRRHTNLTQDLGTSFVNHENDYTIEEKPPYGTGGWTTGDRSVLLYDRYDIWEVRPDGSRAVRLTDGAAERVRHRRMWLDPDDRVVDRSRPLYIALHGETTRQYGYGRVRGSSGVERLVFADRNFSRLGRAKDADIYFYRVEAFDESPNFYAGGPDLGRARRITDTNPFQADYAWGRSELISFRNAAGRELQAALHYPANYEPGRQYPMIVYIYETTSPLIHNYSVPSETSAHNPTVFTQNGYFVLRPDIVYRGRDPGVSAVEALVPAVERVIEMGVVDGDRIGLVGHSWGGYQTAFTVTQTDLFRAAVAAAPLTNLISMYLSVFSNLGMTNARIFEVHQVRMEVPFWEDVESYIRNSPVFHIERMNTPLLVAFGDEDGAVEFNQGVELYNAARRAGKDMVLLVYAGENHSLAKKPNQIDYHRRVMQWFGHYLKEEPAPDWITSGVSHRERQRELELLRRSP